MERILITLKWLENRLINNQLWFTVKDLDSKGRGTLAQSIQPCTSVEIKIYGQI